VKNEFKVSSLAKALTILECFTADSPELGISQISERLIIGKTTVHNIVSTFKKMGYLEQNPENGKYHIGLKMLEYSYIVNEYLGFQRAIYPVVQSILPALEDILYIGVPKDNYVIYLFAHYPLSKEFDYPMHSMMGKKAPMYCTGIGKAMLAFLPGDIAEIYIKQPRKRITQNTIVDENALRNDLNLTRLRGYSIDNMEHESDISCIGVPIFNSRNVLIAAMSISVYMTRFNDELIKRYSELLMTASMKMKTFI